MKNNGLHRSEELSHHFAPRREAAPLLSSAEVDALLDRHDIGAPSREAKLPNTLPTQHTVRNTIMTLTGLATLGGIAYLAYFSAPQTTHHANTRAIAPSAATSQTSIVSPAHAVVAKKEVMRQPDKPITKVPEHGPWSAGQDQFYVDLSRDELKKIGIDFNFDTVLVFGRDAKGKVERLDLTPHYIGNKEAMPNQGVSAPPFHPVLMTSDGGHSAAFQTFEKGRKRMWGLTNDNSRMDERRAYFNKPGTPGLTILGYATAITRHAP